MVWGARYLQKLCFLCIFGYILTFKLIFTKALIWSVRGRQKSRMTLKVFRMCPWEDRLPFSEIEKTLGGEDFVKGRNE